MDSCPLPSSEGACRETVRHPARQARQGDAHRSHSLGRAGRPFPPPAVPPVLERALHNRTQNLSRCSPPARVVAPRLRALPPLRTRRLRRLTLRLNGDRWLIPRAHVQPGLRRSRVLIEQRLDGSSWVRYRGRHLPLQLAPPPAASPSGLRPPGPAAKPKLPAKAWHPPKDHPWRQACRLHMLKRTLLPGAKADISTLR